VTVTGDRSFGLHAKSTIGGDVTVQGGAVTVTGAGAVGIALDDNVAGRLVINQTVIATGYRSTTRPADTVLAKITADEMQIGGSAVRIQGDVAGGVLIAAPPPTADSSIPDVNKDGSPTPARSRPRCCPSDRRRPSSPGPAAAAFISAS
jgi:hypothetical protein